MIQSRRFAELSTLELYEILRLRAEVFVVEQACVYGDVDGRDTEPGTRHLFVARASEKGGVELIAYLRTLAEVEGRAIGRVVTAPRHRGQGHASRLIASVLQATSGTWVLSAQCQLETWYSRFGFVRAGEDFDEDGILHLPMRRVGC